MFGIGPLELVVIVVVAQGELSSRRLVAFYMEKADRAQTQLPPTADTLRAFVQPTLPEHLIPSFFVLLDAIPLTPNGKIDRRRLERIDAGSALPQAQARASTDTERNLIDVWADVLRIANSSLYRVTPEPVESIQRAIVVCGLDGMRGILATAMVRPVFRASGKNFPRLPRLLWQRTERATRAAELYALKICPQDRFEAQLAVLLSALGPLVAHSAALDAYAQRPRLKPDASLLVELTRSVAPSMSVCIAQAWGLSQRILSALSRAASGPLAIAARLAPLFLSASAGSKRSPGASRRTMMNSGRAAPIAFARSSNSRPIPSLSTVAGWRYQAKPSTPTWVILPPKQP